MEFLGGVSMKHSPGKEKPQEQLDLDTLVSSSFEWAG